MIKLAQILLPLTLVSCAMPTHDMINNNFSDVQPLPADTEVVGKWTGSNGPYLLTIGINANGTGMYCSSWNDKNTLGRLKHTATGIHFQDGVKMVIQPEGQHLIGKFAYFGANTVSFRRDDSLTEAAPYCAESL